MMTTEELASKCVEELAYVFGLAVHFVKVLRFNKADKQHLVSVCLYARLVELASACSAMIEARAYAGIPIVLRSMFEADVDLTNCLRSKDYVQYMQAQFAKEFGRLRKEIVSNTSNPYLQGIVGRRDMDKVLRQAEKDLKKLTAAGFKPLTIKESAELAGKQNEYGTVYNVLCLQSHNNIAALVEWHIESSDAQNCQVILFKQTLGDLLPEISTIPRILLFQTQAMKAFFKTEGVVLDAYLQRQEQLRIAIVENAPAVSFQKPPA